MSILRKTFSGVAALALTAGSFGAVAQSLSPELAELDAQLPGDLINDPTSLAWPTQGEDLRVESIADEAIPGGGAAAQFEVQRQPAEIYGVAANIELLDDIAAGDVVTVGFYARTLSADTDDGSGVLGIRVQQNAAPYAGFIDATVAVGSEWEWYEVSGTATRKIARSQAIVSLQLGGARQTLQIGQTIVVKGAPSIVGAPTPAVAEVPMFTDLLPEPLQGVGRLLNRPDSRNWGNLADHGSFANRDEPAIWLGRATRYSSPGQGTNPWDLGTLIPIDGAIEEGDTLMVAVAARTESAATDDGRALVGVRVQQTEPPYDGFADNQFSVGPKWQLIRIKTQATRSFAAGKGAIALHFANAEQAVDIGPVYVLKVD